MDGAKPKIITFGAAVQDVFLQGDVFTPKKEGDQLVEEFPLGAKMDLDGIAFSTGGGATNASVTFTRQGIDSGFMGKIGHDPAGEAVIADLKREKVDVANVVYSNEHSTGYSVLLLAPSGERTILTYRGASTHYDVADFKLDNAHGDWFYISSLAGNMDVLEKIIHHAAERHIHVALNPGKGELKETERLRALLPHVTIFSANLEETQSLFEGQTMQELARSAAQTVQIAVVTDGPNGVAACNGRVLCSGGMYEDVPVIDRTGAGDAFASGFTAAVAKGMSLEQAVVLASANSTSVVGKIGAKEGILRDIDNLHDMPLQSEQIA